MGFSDILGARLLPKSKEAGRPVLYSRGMYGYSDLGASRRPLRSRLAPIGAAVERLPR